MNESVIPLSVAKFVISSMSAMSDVDVIATSVSVLLMAFMLLNLFVLV